MPELAPAAQLAWIAAAAALLMAGLWLVQRRTRDAGVVDAGWALGIAAASVFAGLTGGGAAEARAFAALAGGLWGLRLGLHLLRDRIIGRGEDGRYAAMRAAMGGHAQAGFLAFFLAQAGLVVLFSVPMALLAAHPAPAPWALALAAAVWLVAMAGETVADRQLAAFRADAATAGTTCRRGLWRYSRHPNYFCEWLGWWAWPLAGLGAAGAAWLWAYPALMLAFLVCFTGIPFVERRARAHRPDYADYQRTTSAFIPWFPRSP
jgi:steroid 5-alpha reductase family enzyme